MTLRGGVLGPEGVRFLRRERPAPGPYEGPLVGRWIHRNEYERVAIVFLPDRRYAREVATEAAVLRDWGTFEAEARRLTLRPSDGEAETYSAATAGDELTLSGPPLGDLVQVYGLEPGSPGTVEEEARAADARKARDDLHARERIRVGPASRSAAAAAAGAPEDPSPDRVFEEATVFLEPGTYSFPAPGARLPTEGVWRRTRWTFLPTGRVHYRSERHEGSGEVSVSEVWGRYRIEEEAVTLETDDRETHSLALEDGRRTLRFGRVAYAREP
jgi:hypothetical protein